VIWPGGRRTARVENGTVRFPAVRTDSLTVRVDEAEPATTLDFDSVTSPLPVGIGELRVRGLPYLPIAVPRKPASYPCGSGPTLVVNGAATATAVTATPADLYAGRTVPARLCGSRSVALQAGDNVVDVRASGAFSPASLVLSGAGNSVPPPLDVPLASSGPVHRTLSPAAASGVLAERENANPGWRATQGGRSLSAVVVDGWQQGWRLRGTGAVTTTFAPDRVYRWGLLGGLVALLGLLLICVVPRRRWRDAPLDPAQSRAASGGVSVAVAVVGGGLLAGWPGALVAAVVCGITWFLSRRAPDAAPWVLAGLVLPAAVAYGLRPWGGSAGWAGSLDWPHYLVLAVCAALFGWPVSPPPGRRRALRRMPGFSTRR
jgi:arabinofuranan 3-O-arabinosyltransferase